MKLRNAGPRNGGRRRSGAGPVILIAAPIIVFVLAGCMNTRISGVNRSLNGSNASVESTLGSIYAIIGNAATLK